MYINKKNWFAYSLRIVALAWGGVGVACMWRGDLVAGLLALILAALLSIHAEIGRER